MEVILNKDVEKIGQIGQVVKVKDGFARNFLIPHGLAVPVTNANIKALEQRNKEKIVQLEKEKNEALALKEKLSALSLTISVLAQGEEGLYGSVNAVDIVNLLKEEGIDINKSAIVLDEPIKALGIYEITVKIHPEVQAKVKVWVVKK